MLGALGWLLLNQPSQPANQSNSAQSPSQDPVRFGSNPNSDRCLDLDPAVVEALSRALLRLSTAGILDAAGNLTTLGNTMLNFYTQNGSQTFEHWLIKQGHAQTWEQAHELSGDIGQIKGVHRNLDSQNECVSVPAILANMLLSIGK
ncbi:hypothetical protein JW710_01060 [Candidatus Dojkabacteria bacterium]|nr:hypothetical protein [Candidatus Dojkabacteria bacterium]